MENYFFRKLEFLVFKWDIIEKFCEYLIFFIFIVLIDNNLLIYLQLKSLNWLILILVLSIDLGSRI